MPSIDERISINKLNITNIQCLYNIQNIKKDGEWRIYSTIFSDLKKMLSLDGVSDENSEIISTERAIEKQLDVTDSIDQIKYLKTKRLNIINDLERVQRHNPHDAEDEIMDFDLTQNSIIPDVNEIPIHCKNRINNNCHPNSCNSHCYYSIDQLKNLAQAHVIDELSIHNHAKSLKKSKKAFYGIKERRNELIEHYKIFHNKI